MINNPIYIKKHHLKGRFIKKKILEFIKKFCSEIQSDRKREIIMRLRILAFSIYDISQISVSHKRSSLLNSCLLPRKSDIEGAKMFS